MGYLPGTMMKISEYELSGYEAKIKPLIAATGGLMLSQVEGITGIGGSTIQNWIKRGWVPPTEGKRYNQRQIYRIILINLLRGGIALEQIAEILKFINGDLNDEGDDIISDSMLLDFLYDVIFQMQNKKSIEQKEIEGYIARTLNRYSGVYKNRETLQKGLNVMINAYIASEIKQRTAKLFREIGE